MTYKKKDYEDLRGTYYIGVYGGSFASYSIYYYSETKAQLADPSKSSVELFNQEIIKDFLYTDSSKFKVYSYILDYSEKNKEDIRIILTPIIGDFEIYVYKPNTKIEYDEKTNTFKGWRWSTYETISDNEVIISKTDKDYVSYGKYLVVVALLENSKYQEASFYLGLSDETNGLNLQANVPVVSVLKKGIFDVQLFNYQITEHQSFLLNLNVFSGSIDLEITLNKAFLGKISSCMDDCKYNLDWEDIQAYCKTKICNIQLRLDDKSQESSTFYNSSKFYLIIKSDVHEAELIYPGFKKHEEVEYKGYNYYYAFIGKDETTISTVFFTNADGKVFAKLEDHVITSKEEVNNLMPKSKSDQNVFFKQQYWNYVLNLTKEQTANCIEFCTLLIAVKGDNDFYGNSNSMEYDISLSNMVVEISLNKPTTSSITAGEYQYYRINFNSAKEEINNLVFSLTNSEGDSDLFVNFSDSLPLIENFDFSSQSFETEIIQLDLDNPFFKDKGLKSLQGVYTIGVYSYVNSTYTLFITPTKEKILPLADYYPSTCTAKANEYCLFNYVMDWIDYAIDDVKGSLKSIIYINFHYGNGIGLAKLMPNYLALNSLPEPNDSKVFKNDFDRNFIRLNFKVEDYPEIFNIEKINKEYYDAKKDNNIAALSRVDTKALNKSYLTKLRPSVIVKITCSMDCSFSIHTAVRYFDDEFYLDPFLDNLVYMPINFKTVLYYFNYQDGLAYDIQFEEMQGTTNFKLVAAQDANNIAAENPSSSIVEKFTINTLSNDSKKKTVSITKKDYDIAQIVSTSQSEESIFFVRILVRHHWMKITPGPDNYYEIDSNQDLAYLRSSFFLYFDFYDDYNSVNINLKCKIENECDIEAYAKFFIFNDKEFNDSRIDFNTLPAPTAYDYQFRSFDSVNSNLGYMQISKPDLAAGQKAVVLIFVTLNYEKISPGNNLNLTLMPNSNQNSFIYLEPEKILYGVQEKSDKNNYDIFEIDKNNQEDNTIEINLSICFGDITYKIFDKPYFDIEKDKSINVEQNFSGGHYIIKVKNIVTNIYIVVQAVEYEPASFCKSKNLNIKCQKAGNDVAQYSISYNSLKEDARINPMLINFITFTHERDYNISFKPISQRIKMRAVAYKLYVTKEESEVAKFGSPCVLAFINNYKDITTEIMSQINSDVYNYTLEGLDAGKYYINVAVFLKSGEVYAYNPTEVLIEKPRWPIFAVIAFVVACVLAGVFFYKYRKTKTRLDLEREDLSNMASTNKYKTDKELREMKNERDNIKYSTLSLDSNSNTSV